MIESELFQSFYKLLTSFKSKVLNEWKSIQVLGRHYER